MAQINITLDQDEVLRLLGDDSGEAVRELEKRRPELLKVAEMQRELAKAA